MLRTPLLSSTFFTSPKCFKRTRDVKARALSINNNVEDVLKIQKDIETMPRSQSSWRRRYSFELHAESSSASSA